MRHVGGMMMLMVAILLATGCGYQQSGDYDSSTPGYKWHSLYREDIRSVAVPIFTTKDFHRGVEFSLTKAIINQLEANTPYKVVPRERADTVLEGEIVSVKVAPVSRNIHTALPQEQLLSVRVNFVWKDIRTGKILVERRSFEQVASYYPSLGEGSFVGNQSAVEKLSLAIVQELQAEW